MGNRLDARLLVLLVIVIVVIVVLVTGIVSCVRGSSTTTTDTQQQTEQEEEKPRVASGISSELSQEFTEALDRNDQLAQIAQNADQYDDDRLLELALNEPDAISFVANYLTADKSGSSYGDTVTKGEVPLLYNWDTRWGYVSYGDGCIGVTGSAPTTVAMAYMGLTGNSDKTPATIAQAVSTSSTSSNSSDSSTTSSSDADSVETMIQLMTSAGLSATQYESSSDTLVACLSDSSVAAVLINDDGLIEDTDAHWALVVGMNSDGSLNVFDPTSTEVSTLTWSSSTIANASSTILYVTVSDNTTEDTDSDDATESDTANGTTSTGSSSTTTDSDASTSGSTDSTSSNTTSSTSTSSNSSAVTSSSSDYIGL